jgi:hypothetical protein
MKKIDELIKAFKSAKHELAKEVNTMDGGDMGQEAMAMSEDEPHKDDPNHEKKEKDKAKQIKDKAQEILDLHKQEYFGINKSTGQWTIQKSMQDALAAAGVKGATPTAPAYKAPSTQVAHKDTNRTQMEESHRIKGDMHKQLDAAHAQLKQKIYADHPTKGMPLHELKESAKGGDKAYEGIKHTSPFGESYETPRIPSNQTKLRREAGKGHGVGERHDLNVEHITPERHAELSSQIKEWAEKNPEAKTKLDNLHRNKVALSQSIADKHDSGELYHGTNSSQRKKMIANFIKENS